MSEKYRFYDPNAVYFTTSTIVDWINVFTQPLYCEIILDSLRYCQKHKKLIIHAWVIMSNHIHMIISRSGDPELSDIMRDFKRHTSVEIVKAIRNNNDSRAGWMLKIFNKAASDIKRVNSFKLWKDGNHPIILDSNTKIEQRLEYLHNNPVKAGIVNNDYEYIYSSAIDYNGGKGLIDIELIC